MYLTSALLLTVACTGVDPTRETAGDTSDSAALPPCEGDPISLVEVGFAGLCATHRDGCVECVALGSDWVEDAGLARPPARDLTGVRLSDGCDSSSEESNCSPQFGACGILPDEQVACWGADVRVTLDGKPGVEATSVSVGYRHACAPDLAGDVQCWGECQNDSCAPPGGSFAAITSGHDFSCGLASDGSAWCWGYDIQAFGPPTDLWAPALAAWAVGPFVEIYAVPGGPCGRDSTDAVGCFSYAGGEALDPISVSGAVSSWTVMQGPTDGAEAVCALTAAGALTCEGTATSIPVDKLASYVFTSISSSYDRLCGVTPDGEIVCAVINENWAYCPFCTEIFPD